MAYLFGRKIKLIRNVIFRKTILRKINFNIFFIFYLKNKKKVINILNNNNNNI